MQEVNKKLLTEVQEASRVESQKMQDANQKLFEAYRAKNQKLQSASLSNIVKELEVTSGKLQEVHESVSKRITCVEHRESHLEKTVTIKWSIWKKPSTENS